MAAKIKKGDKVVVLTGRDKGKTGEVVQMLPKEERALVRGVNLVKRHQRQTANTGGWHHLERGVDPPVEPGLRRPEGRQADPGWFQSSRRRPQGPFRQAFGGPDRWLRLRWTATRRG